MKSSPALQIIGKMKNTLKGRAIGILIADGSDGVVIKKIKKAATEAGASVKVIAPKVGGAKLAGGSMLAADGQLAGTPSVLFDAVAIILSDEGAQALSRESAGVDFVRDAFGHLKAIAADKGAQALLKAAENPKRSRRGKCRRRGCVHRCRKEAAMGSRKICSDAGLTQNELGSCERVVRCGL